MSTPAVSTINWPTKAEAGRALGVSTKTVEKYVEQGRLRQQMQSQINKPARAVIDPETLERMISERSLAVTVREQPQNTSSEVVRESLLSLFSAREMPPSELAHKLWLTEDEAVRYTGLGRGTLARMVKAERLTAERIGPRGAVVYRRAGLEGL